LVREKRYGTDKKERTWLCENTANLYKVGGDFFWEDDSYQNKRRSQWLRKKRHWSGEEGAEYVVGKQQKAGESGRRFFGGK
ncbi:hypothetical protein T11_1131, partial [Trichinella zimbabwensis]